MLTKATALHDDPMTGLMVNAEPHDGLVDVATVRPAGEVQVRQVELVDVAALPPAASGSGPVVSWSASNQLQTNVVTLPPHGVIDWHVEAVLDVTVTVLVGSMTVHHGPDAELHAAVLVSAPAVAVLPAGTRRSFTAGPDGATYLTAHRARTGLMPTVR